MTPPIETSRPRLLRRLRAAARGLHWPVLGGLAVLSLALGYWGFAVYFTARGEPASPSDILYLLVQLFVLESGAVEGSPPWPLDVARWLAPAVAGVTAFKALAVVFRDQLEALRVGRLRGHVVICGLGRKGHKLARSLVRQGERVVVLELDGENDLVARARSEALFVRIGDARDPDFLRATRLHRAAHLITLCGDDGTNAEIALQARRLVRERPGGGSLSCLVQIADPRLCSLLQQAEIERYGEEPIRVEYFNAYDVGARWLVLAYPPAGAGREGQQEGEQIVIAGLGRFGRSVLHQVARLWGEGGGAVDRRLKVTVVDREASARIGAAEVSQCATGAGFALEAIDLEFESPEFREAAFLFSVDGVCRTTAAYICTDDDSTSLLAGLALERKLRGSEVPIVVRMVHDAGLATLLAAQGAGAEYPNLHAFGLLDRVCTSELLVSGPYQKISRAQHEEYLSEQVAAGRPLGSTPALVPWADLPGAYRESSLDQAAHTGVKLRAVGCELEDKDEREAVAFAFTPEEIELLSCLEHRRWVNERRRAGWTLGERDDRRKRHPDLVPWAELSEEKRDIDRLFIRAMPKILAQAGYAIVRSRAGLP